LVYTVDPRIDTYIDALPAWQQAICREVRELVHAADPDVVETIKRTRQPYFVLDGNICALLAAKDHVNVFLYDGAIVPDPEGIITAGHDNQTARTVAIRQGEMINARALTAMFKHIIANNRAGGWRKLKTQETRGVAADREEETLQTPDVLMAGIVFGEQPRWHDGRLWFSDWGTQEVIAVDRDGTTEIMHRGSSFPLCVDWLPDGRLLVVDTSMGRLLVQETDGSLEMYADLRQGSDPPAGNELVVDGRGNAYVNGGGFNMMAGEPYAPDWCRAGYTGRDGPAGR